MTVAWGVCADTWRDDRCQGASTVLARGADNSQAAEVSEIEDVGAELGLGWSLPHNAEKPDTATQEQ